MRTALLWLAEFVVFHGLCVALVLWLFGYGALEGAVR